LHDVVWWAPWEAMSEVRERPPLNVKMSPPLRGDHVGDALMLVKPGRVMNNSYVKDVGGRPNRR
jgi:hypothetical protein